jgi:hypothetical protein
MLRRVRSCAFMISKILRAHSSSLINSKFALRLLSILSIAGLISREDPLRKRVLKLLPHICDRIEGYQGPPAAPSALAGSEISSKCEEDQFAAVDVPEGHSSRSDSTAS